MATLRLTCGLIHDIVATRLLEEGFKVKHIELPVGDITYKTLLVECTIVLYIKNTVYIYLIENGRETYVEIPTDFIIRMSVRD